MDNVSRRTALKFAAAGVTVLGAGAVVAQDKDKQAKTKFQAKEEVTFEGIDKQIGKADLAGYQAGGKYQITKALVSDAPGDVLKRICPAYAAIRGILVGFSQSPFIPEPWRRALRVFIAAMDIICA